jgi:hypothetical protein
VSIGAEAGVKPLQRYFACSAVIPNNDDASKSTLAMVAQKRVTVWNVTRRGI